MLDKTNDLKVIEGDAGKTLPTTWEIGVRAGDLHDALRRVQYAICREATRYYLGGVYVNRHDESLRFVATDGHVLGRTDANIVCGDSARIFPAILSRAWVLDALKATKRQRDSYKTVTLRVGQERAALIDWAGGCVAEAALVDGAFPDYTRVVPVGDPPKGRVTVLREQLIGAVTAVTAFAKASDGNRSPHLCFSFGSSDDDGKLIVSKTADDGFAKATVMLAKAPPAPVDIGFDDEKLLAVLKGIDASEVRIDLYDVGGPCNVGSDYAVDAHVLHTIMPCRIN